MLVSVLPVGWDYLLQLSRVDEYLLQTFTVLWMQKVRASSSKDTNLLCVSYTGAGALAGTRSELPCSTILKEAKNDQHVLQLSSVLQGAKLVSTKYGFLEIVSKSFILCLSFSLYYITRTISCHIGVRKSLPCASHLIQLLVYW